MHVLITPEPDGDRMLRKNHEGAARQRPSDRAGEELDTPVASDAHQRDVHEEEHPQKIWPNGSRTCVDSLPRRRELGEPAPMSTSPRRDDADHKSDQKRLASGRLGLFHGWARKGCKPRCRLSNAK